LAANFDFFSIRFNDEPNIYKIELTFYRHYLRQHKMAVLQNIAIDEFLNLRKSLPVLDVRSEGEYKQGHICNALNFPILNDEERKLVGICYKQKGHEKAVILGYQLTGPKFFEMIKQAYKQFPEKKILIHCFRGGLRSRIMSYVLHSAGFDVKVLVGGYKVYRKHVLSVLESDLKMKVIGGYTGTGKSEILIQLKEKGKQIIDIESLANHRGSAFGGINMPAQPTQEQFENDLAEEISILDLDKDVWIEDESRSTGKIKMPDKFYNQLRNANLYFIEKSFDKRAANILNTYGKFDKNLLIASTEKLEKRLGNLLMRQAVTHLENNEMKEWLDIVLHYYDKAYQFGLEQRDKKKVIHVSEKEFIFQYENERLKTVT